MDVDNSEILFILSKGINTFKTELRIDKQYKRYDNFDIEKINEVILYYNRCLLLLKKSDHTKIVFRHLKKHRLIKLRKDR